MYWINSLRCEKLWCCVSCGGSCPRAEPRIHIWSTKLFCPSGTLSDTSPEANNFATRKTQAQFAGAKETVARATQRFRSEPEVEESEKGGGLWISACVRAFLGMYSSQLRYDLSRFECWGCKA
jgi:hypothetical protein